MLLTRKRILLLLSRPYLSTFLALLRTPPRLRKSDVRIANLTCADATRFRLVDREAVKESGTAGPYEILLAAATTGVGGIPRCVWATKTIMVADDSCTVTVAGPVIAGGCCRRADGADESAMRV